MWALLFQKQKHFKSATVIPPMNEICYIIRPRSVFGDCVCESLLVKNTQYYKNWTEWIEIDCEASTAWPLLEKCPHLDLGECSTFPTSYSNG